MEGPAVSFTRARIDHRPFPDPKIAHSRPQEPMPDALPDRLHLGGGKINGTVQRFKRLNGCDAWICISQRSFVRGIDRIFIGQIFNRVAQNF